jgi:hypothetical protein
MALSDEQLKMKVKEIRNDPDIFFSVGYYDKKTKNIRE